jgi:enoyl-CoA hydratase/carnithine racemase
MESAKTCKKQIDPSSGALLPLRIHRLKKPSIAVINGYALGVGMGLALACDIRLASERAIFSEAFVKMGLVPGDGSCWQLPRMISLSDTYLLQYTGDKIDGAEALRIGLISKLYSHNTVLREALKLAERIAAGPTLSHSLTKYLIQESMDLSLEESLDLANGAQTIARDSEDHSEAVKAFLEKRSPHFKGK